MRSKILHNFWRLFFCTQVAHKCYISSFNLFHLVQTRVRDFGPEKKKIWNLTLGFNFPHHPQAKVKSPLREGLTSQIPNPRVHKTVKCPGFTLKFRFDPRIAACLNWPAASVGLSANVTRDLCQTERAADDRTVHIASNISNTRRSVSSDIQTLRRALKKRGVFFEQLLGVSICDETLFGLFDIASKSINNS